MIAASERLSWSFVKCSLIQIMFPSRSISICFEFFMYLRIELIVSSFNFGVSNFCRFLIFGQPDSFFKVVKKQFNCSSVNTCGDAIFPFFLLFFNSNHFHPTTNENRIKLLYQVSNINYPQRCTGTWIIYMHSLLFQTI